MTFCPTPSLRFRSRTGRLLPLFCLCAIWSFGVAAQTPAPEAPSDQAPPAHLGAVDAGAVIERDRQTLPAELNTVVLAGDRLRTDRGRVELIFGDGSALDLDQFTTVDLLSDSLLRLKTGRARVFIARVSNDVNYRVDAAGSSISIESAGDYLISAAGDPRAALSVDLAVIRGTAELANTSGRTIVRAGAHAWAREDGAPSPAEVFNTSAADPFDDWVETQRTALPGGESSKYLPSDIRNYAGLFDAYGSWQDDPDSGGEVWYPNVAPGWSPNDDGRLESAGTIGVLWVSVTPWAWPAYHYGRWGVTAGRWFWVPPDWRDAHAWVARAPVEGETLPGANSLPGRSSRPGPASRYDSGSPLRSPTRTSPLVPQGPAFSAAPTSAPALPQGVKTPPERYLATPDLNRATTTRSGTPTSLRSDSPGRTSSSPPPGIRQPQAFDWPDGQRPQGPPDQASTGPGHPADDAGRSGPPHHDCQGDDPPRPKPPSPAPSPAPSRSGSSGGPSAAPPTPGRGIAVPRVDPPPPPPNSSTTPASGAASSTGRGGGSGSR